MVWLANHCRGNGQLRLQGNPGLSVGFVTAAALVHELMEARDERRLLRLQKQMVAILDACCEAWNALVGLPDTLRSIATREWAKEVNR